MSDIVEVEGLVKHFGRTRALDGLDLAVSAGEVHGFLGPNGAGKSTTIRVLLGMIRPTGGRASVFGLDPWERAVEIHRRIAYVPGDVSLWPGLSGGEVIDLLTSLRGGADASLRAQLIEEFEFDPRTKSRNYSKGNRQKVALIAAFGRPADLYVFDEPTGGLDPVMESVFRRQVARVREQGATVLLSSHILSEVEKLCDRVTIIRAGKTVERGTLASLRHLTRTTFSVAGADAASIAALPGVHDVAEANGKLQFDVDANALQPTLQALAAAQVTALTVSPPSLEQLFLSHYSDPVAR